MSFETSTHHKINRLLLPTSSTYCFPWSYTVFLITHFSTCLHYVTASPIHIQHINITSASSSKQNKTDASTLTDNTDLSNDGSDSSSHDDVGSKYFASRTRDIDPVACTFLVIFLLLICCLLYILKFRKRSLWAGERQLRFKLSIFEDTFKPADDYLKKLGQFTDNISPYDMKYVLDRGPRSYHMEPPYLERLFLKKSPNPDSPSSGCCESADTQTFRNEKTDNHLGVLVSECGKLIRFAPTSPFLVATVMCNYPLFHTTTEEFYYFEVQVLKLTSGAVLSIGLSRFPNVPFQLPGWSLDSFGFCSDDGMIIADGDFDDVVYYEHGYEEGDIVGCGYRPTDGIVFYTIRKKSDTQCVFLGDIFVGRMGCYKAVVGCLQRKAFQKCPWKARKKNNISPLESSPHECIVRVNFGTEHFVFWEANMGLNDPEPPPSIHSERDSQPGYPCTIRYQELSPPYSSPSCSPERRHSPKSIKDTES